MGKTKYPDLALVIIISIAIIFLGFLLYYYTINSSRDLPQNLNLNSNDPSFYDENKCRCLEKKNPKCTLEGFEYNMTIKLCVNKEENKVTYATLTCSKYECSGKIYEFDLESKKWGEFS